MKDKSIWPGTYDYMSCRLRVSLRLLTVVLRAVEIAVS